MTGISKAICIMGPTAMGKTEIAIALAERFPCRIISVDSALIYRGMDIGTAKPDSRILQHTPHHLIDIRDPDESYSVAEFCADAMREIEQAHAQNRIPLLVGGTMMYFHALEHGITPLPHSDPIVRRRLQNDMEQKGLSSLHARLRQVDPESAHSIHPNDPQRIQRALEVYEITGIPLSELHKKTSITPLARLFKLALIPTDRSRLHARIAQRFKQMLRTGLIDEVRTLRQKYSLNAKLPSMRCVGYRQTWCYLEGDYDQTTLLEKGIAATRQLAKRQLTWVRGSNNSVIVSTNPDRPDDVFQHVQNKLENSGYLERP